MNETPPVKLRHISIKDYKGIEHLELDFPAPELPGDPDVVVIGSENGLGKTSVLECCSLLLFSLSYADLSVAFKHIDSGIDFPGLFVRAGYCEAEISGDIEYERKKLDFMLTINKNGMKADSKHNRDAIHKILHQRKTSRLLSKRDLEENFLREICGFSSDSIIDDLLLFFHSYRKTQEGNPRFGSLFDEGERAARRNYRYRDGSSISIFKRVALFSIMGKADLFDRINEKDSNEILDKLNTLVENYAGGKISKLRPAYDDTIEFRVQPTNGGDSFNFDGLSSGQKEIITTLFLIWYETRNQPKVVLIDEPELHLNSQWHRSFINSLIELAPQNQYIIATHSPTIMDSVDRSRRILLQRDKEAVR